MRFTKSDKGSEATPRPEPEHDDADGHYPISRVCVEYEHRSGLGEDAKPIWMYGPSMHGLIGVFDGLGGAGGEPVRTRDGQERTGAWVASRLAHNVTIDVYGAFVTRVQSVGSFGGDELYDQAAVLPEVDRPFDFAVELRRVLQERFVKAAATYGSGGSLLKSRLIKVLPTTLAICAYDLVSNVATAIWAGDSRVYQLAPDVGLQQITTDDLKSNADALENLTQDAPMSNCVSADTDFVLHERQFTLRPQSVLMAASDGCFGYVQTPMHFEYILLSTMQEATGFSDWEARLTAEIKRVTSDDSTLSAVAMGWRNFAACKQAFAARYRSFAQRHKAYDELSQRVAALDQELEQARSDLAATTQELWEKYRVEYEALAKGPIRTVPDRPGDARTEGSGAK